MEFSKDRTVLLLLTSSSNGLRDVLCHEPAWSLEGQTHEGLHVERVAREAPGTVLALCPSCNSCLQHWCCQLQHACRRAGCSQFGRDGWEGTEMGPSGVAAASLFPSALCKQRQTVLMRLFAVKSTDLVTSGCFLSLCCVC